MPAIVANVRIPTLCVHTPLDSRAKLNYQYRNKLINGDFSVWQRGASFLLSSSAYTADRWLANLHGNITRVGFIPGESELMSNDRYYMHTKPTGIGTPTLTQRIPDVRTLAGKAVTLTLWARGTAGEKLAISYQQNFGTGGSPSATISTNALQITLTTAWKKHTITDTIPSVLGKTIGTNEDSYLALVIQQPLSETDVAHIQLEEGMLATDFEKRPYSAELRDCLRYCEVVAVPTGMLVMPGMAISDTAAYCTLDYTPKHSVPTITMPTELKLLDGDGVVIDTAWTQGVSGVTRGSIVGAVESGLEAGNAVMAQADDDCAIIIDSEI